MTCLPWTLVTRRHIIQSAVGCSRRWSVMYCSAVQCTHTKLLCIALHYGIVHCSVLHYSVLHCSLLHYSECPFDVEQFYLLTSSIVSIKFAKKVHLCNRQIFDEIFILMSQASSDLTYHIAVGIFGWSFDMDLFVISIL